MDRRTFLLGLVGLAGCQYVPYSKEPVIPNPINSIDQLVVDFYDALPHTKKIEKYLFPGSQFVVVHIKQHHLYDEIKEEELEIIKKVQHNIYGILLNLNARYGIDKAYCEGITCENEAFENVSARLNFLMKYPDRVEVIDTPQFRKWLRSIDRNIEEIKGKEPSVYKAHMQKRRKLQYSVTYDLASDRGNFEIRAAEDPKISKKADDLYKLGDSGPIGSILAELMGAYYYIYTLREDIALLYASLGEDPFRVVIYGAGHNFLDNMKKWNEEHPYLKGSLIVMTPEGL